MTKLVLASASPRRRELLGLLGHDFEVFATGIEELTEGDPAELVVENAIRKAQAAVAGADDDHAIVIGVDTDVVLDGRLLGKPGDDAAARERIAALSGRTHRVLSGICVIGAERRLTGLVQTDVTFRDLDASEIDRYVESGEWRDRAGGYAVQGFGSSLIAAIDGDLSNVIGLPLAKLAAMIEDLQNG